MKVETLRRLGAGFALMLASLVVVLVETSGLGSAELLETTGGVVSLFWGAALLAFLPGGINAASARLYYSFLFVFGLFHIGIPLGFLIGSLSDDATAYIERWYFGDYTQEALIAVYLFLTGYLAALLVPGFSTTNRNFAVGLRLDDTALDILFWLYVGLVAFWIVVIKLIYGISTYSEYHQNSDIPLLRIVYVYFNGAIGFLYVVLSLYEKYRKKALVMFGVWGILAFPMGLRGEVLFPLAIAGPVLIASGVVRVTYVRAMTGLMVTLLLISFVFNYREQGQIEEGASISPAAAIVEMGGSLRPVHEVFKWIETGDVDYQLGKTYWAPFERTLANFVPFLTVPPAEEDMRLMNVAIMSKAGPYGFSIVAEAFVNFGWAGVLGLGFLAGRILLGMDRRRARLSGLSVIELCFVFALFFHIRQSFVGAFGIFAVSLALCLGAIALSRLLTRSSAGAGS